MQILKDEVKDKIVKASKRLFKANGYGATSMRDIAKDAGISTGNIYRYFITKKQLLNEILNEVQTEIENFLNSVPSDYKEIDHQKMFNMLTDATVNIAREKADELEVLFNCEDESHLIACKEHLTKITAQKMKEMAKSIDVKECDDVLCEAIASSLFEGFAYIVRKDGRNIDVLKEKLDIYTKIMILGIEQRVENIVKKGVCTNA